ncbi:MAG: NUDIX hydrolase [Gammaproteobacteria bacterium]|nr:NUDIX hydrolase [Gammaproteobacteria bacterium]
MAPAQGAQEGGTPDRVEAAGCLIATPHGFVMAVNRLMNRLQLPAGKREPGESARQTAARETREETGLEVSVGEVLLNLDDGRVVFFSCKPVSPAVDYARLVPRDRVEVSRAIVVNPESLTTFDGEKVDTRWRFPHMRWLLRSLFGALAHGGA